MRNIFYFAMGFIIVHILRARPLSLVTFVLFFVSCSTPHYVYQVTSQNLPSLEKKGDVQVDAFFSGGEEEGGTSSDGDKSYSRGFDGNLAYAITDHWAVTASVSYRWERLIFADYNYDASGISSGETDTKYYRMNWELGGGYFTCIDPAKRLSLQLFAGIGGGRYGMNENYSDRFDGYGNRYHDANIFRFYFSPALHIRINEHFTLAAGAKLTNVKYRKIKTDIPGPDLYQMRLEGLEGKTLTFFEPCADFKFRFRKVPWIQPHVQVALSSGSKDYDTRNFSFAVGLTFLTPSKWYPK